MSPWRKVKEAHVYDGSSWRQVADFGPPGPAPTAPGVPTGLAGTPSSTSIALSWTASSAPSSGGSVDFYEVESPAGSGTIVSRPGGTSTTVSGLTAGTAYTFRVRAVSDAGVTSAFCPAVSVTTTGAVADGFALVLEEQFASLSASRWKTYDGSNFGSPTRIQIYNKENVAAGVGASAGATGGTSLRLTSLETDRGTGTLPDASGAGTRYSYTAGMLDTKGVGYYLPLYCRIVARMRIPHGQGLWPAFWLTGANGGASMVEVDTMEYFHTNTPGQILFTLHRTNNAGTAQTNVNKGRGVYEEPNYTPRWVTIQQDIVPENGVPDAPTTNVRFKGWIDGTLIWNYLDTQANYWTTNCRVGGDSNRAYNLYIQGCQIDGTYVGHPRSPLGYQHWRNACSISGTAPNSCALTYQGHGPIIAPRFDGVANVFEIDYVKVWRFTG